MRLPDKAGTMAALRRGAGYVAAWVAVFYFVLLINLENPAGPAFAELAGWWAGLYASRVLGLTLRFAGGIAVLGFAAMVLAAATGHEFFIFTHRTMSTEVLPAFVLEVALVQGVFFASPVIVDHVVRRIEARLRRAGR